MAKFIKWPIQKKFREKQQLSPEDQKDLQFVEDFFKKGLEIRKPYEIIWYRNMAYFLGYQYIQYDPLSETLSIPPAPPWRVRAVDNHIQPNALYTTSKLTKNNAVFVPIPNKNNPNAFYANEVTKKILLHIQQNNLMKTKDWQLRLMAYIYGLAYKDIIWDIEMGDPVVISDDGQIIYTGDVNILIRSPFEVVWEEGATDVDNSFRIGTMTVRDLEYVRKRWPKTGKYVEPEPIEGVSSLEKMLLTLMNKKFLKSNNYDDEQDDKHKFQQGKVVVKQLREKPSAQFPKGRLITIANGVLLDKSELPYEFMWKYRHFGIFKYDFIKLHERWAGESPVNIQIPIQDRINKLQSSILEILNEMAKPKWLVPKQANIPKTSIDNETGEVIEYTAVPGIPEPHPIAGEGPDRAFYLDLENTRKSIENAAMLHDTSKGLHVKGVDSKILAEYLHEQDITVYGPVAMRFEELDEKLYTFALSLFKEKAIEPRVLQILGENNEVENFDYNQEIDFPTAVRVIPGSSIPESLIVKNQRILEWFNAGLFGDPRQPDSINDSIRMKIMTMTELGNVDEVFRQLKADIREARREHQLWEKGIVPPVNPYDNHVVMLEEHDLWRKSDIYRHIQETNPELALKIEEHITQHIQMHPDYNKQQELLREKERIKNIEDNKVALDLLEKKANIKEKLLESRLSLLKSLGNKNVSEQQTVKG